MVPHNHSLSDHEVKDVINSEPVVVPFNLEVSMLTDKEFDARASALLEEGIRSEIEAFKKLSRLYQRSLILGFHRKKIPMHLGIKVVLIKY
jgi:hypothetical protein